jgi:hypothetical protein
MLLLPKQTKLAGIVVCHFIILQLPTAGLHGLLVVLG